MGKGFATNEQRDRMLIGCFWQSVWSIGFQNATRVYYHSASSFEKMGQKVQSEEYAVATNKSAINRGDKKGNNKHQKTRKMKPVHNTYEAAK